MGRARRGRVAALLVLWVGACGGGDGANDGPVPAASPATTTTSPTTTTAPTPAAVAEAAATGSTTLEPAATVTLRASTTTSRTAAGPANATTTPTSGASSGAPAPTQATAPPTTTAPPPTTTAPPTGEAAALAIRNFTFQPPALRVSSGTTVTATNFDAATHTWTSDEGAWDSGNLARDATFSRAFPTAGTFPYHCTIHSSMKGTIVVEG